MAWQDADDDIWLIQIRRRQRSQGDKSPGPFGLPLKSGVCVVAAPCNRWLLLRARGLASIHFERATRLTGNSEIGSSV